MRRLRTALGTFHFVNLDEIARGLSPLEPRAADRAAARVALARARELMRSGVTFAMETTLAGRTHRELVAAARADGLRVGLLYFAVADVGLCLERVARRVAEGGHDVPEADVRRRFARSPANFALLAALADRWRLLDATGRHPSVVAEGVHDRSRFRDEEGLAGLPAELAVPALAA